MFHLSIQSEKFYSICSLKRLPERERGQWAIVPKVLNIVIRWVINFKTIVNSLNLECSNVLTTNFHLIVKFDISFCTFVKDREHHTIFFKSEAF